jgi:hypothetical protein
MPPSTAAVYGRKLIYLLLIMTKCVKPCRHLA